MSSVNPKYNTISYIKNCTKALKENDPIPKIEGNLCGEVDVIVNTIYRSPICISLEIQALYTMNKLVNDLIIGGKEVTAAHINAIIGTLLAWGRIPTNERCNRSSNKGRTKFRLAKSFEENPQSAIQLIKDVLSIKVGNATLRHLARKFDIVMLAEQEDARSLFCNSVISATKKLYSGEATWGYKTLHLIAPSMFTAYDSNINRILVSAGTTGTRGKKCTRRYILYSICLGSLAKYLIDNCDLGFKSHNGFGKVLELDINGLRLYLPLTRLLDYVVWSMSTRIADITVYDFVVGACGGR